MLLKIDKTWQKDAEHLIWQLHDRSSNRRLFLSIGIDQQQAHVSWDLQKPSFSPVAHPMTERLRKFGPQGTLTHFIERTEEPRWIVGIKMTHHDPMALLVYGGKENGMNLVEITQDKVFSLVRVAQGKTYTKRHVVEDERIVQLLEPILSNAELSFKIELDDEKEHLEPSEIGSSKQHDFIRALRRRLRTLKKSLLQLPTTSAEQVTQLEKKAKLLQSFMHLVKPEQPELFLESAQTGESEDIVIELSSEKTASQNTAEMFGQVKKLRRQIEHVKKQRQGLEKSVHQIEEALSLLEKENITDEFIQQMSTELGIRSPLVGKLQKIKGNILKSEPRGRPGDQSKKGRSYVIGDHLIFVGRHAEENDRLTKYAQANDYWFHVAQAPGSHVILVARRQDDTLNEHHPAVRSASILALHFSSRRSHREGEVFFTQRRHLTKIKGQALGEWTVRKGKTLSIRYDDVELREILEKAVP